MTLKIRNEIRKLQENPWLGEYRVHTALLRMEIEVSPATCGRIMAANRQLYGLEKPHRQPRAKLEMPFKASHRHEYWSADIRYIYEDTLKVEHQATTLSLYSVRLSPDQRQITEVKNACRLETHFRSPQLDLWRLSDTEWLLALRRPEQKHPKKHQAQAVVVQLRFPEMDVIWQEDQAR